MSGEPENIKYAKKPLNKELSRAKQRNRTKSATREEKAEIKALTDKMNEQKNNFIRQIAEMDNYVKIREREVESSKKNSRKEVILKLIPLLDTLNAGIEVEGHREILLPFKSQLSQTLSDLGLSEINSINETFNPSFHEVVSVTDEGENNKIVAEVQKGYLFNNEVIRTSKVIVCKR